MTREEAIEILYERKNTMEYVTDNDDPAFDMAIEALAQEPCEDAISRQATLAEFKRLYYDDKTVIRCAELVINGMPNVNLQEPRWIPVSERLPEKSGKYLCTHGGTYLIGTDFYETQSDAIKDGFDDFGWTSQNVIAWMPLPVGPYKVEGGEE